MIIFVWTIHNISDSRPGRLSLQLHKNNAFEVRLGNYALLASSNVFMNINNKTYSTDDGTLHLVDKTMDKGSDALGKWQATRYQFRPAGLKNRMIASIYTYTDQPFMLFEQVPNVCYIIWLWKLYILIISFRKLNWYAVPFPWFLELTILVAVPSIDELTWRITWGIPIIIQVYIN